MIDLKMVERRASVERGVLRIVKLRYFPIMLRNIQTLLGRMTDTKVRGMKNRGTV